MTARQFHRWEWISLVGALALIIAGVVRLIAALGDQGALSLPDWITVSILLGAGLLWTASTLALAIGRRRRSREDS